MLGQIEGPDFSKNFLISLGGHLLLVLLAFAGGQVAMHFFKNNDVEIIRSSIRVDVVGMPKFTIQELKALEKEASLPTVPEKTKGAAEETKPEIEDVVKKDDLVMPEESKKKKKVSFLSLVTDYSTKKIDRKEQAKGSKKGVGAKNLDSLIIEGNRLSKGSALVGDYSNEVTSEFAAYVQTLPGIIRQFWKLPSYLKEQDLRCKIILYLSPAGQVLKTELMESSGQAEFDARAEKAIRDAAPFPRPSEGVGARLTNSGIVLRFPL